MGMEIRVELTVEWRLKLWLHNSLKMQVPLPGQDAQNVISLVFSSEFLAVKIICSLNYTRP